MPDFVSKEIRSKIMSNIKSKDTSIDRKVALLLKNASIKFKQYPKMQCNPDFMLVGKKIVVFCDGDFWHGYNFKKLEVRLSLCSERTPTLEEWEVPYGRKCIIILCSIKTSL